MTEPDLVSADFITYLESLAVKQILSYFAEQNNLGIER